MALSPNANILLQNKYEILHSIPLVLYSISSVSNFYKSHAIMSLMHRISLFEISISKTNICLLNLNILAGTKHNGAKCLCLYVHK
jgi:hypothetical protein